MVAHLNDKLKRVHCKLLGLQVTPLTLETLLAELQGAVTENRRSVIAAHNLHSAYLFHSNAEFRSFYQSADVILTDGAPVQWDYRLSRNRLPNTRLGSTDWLPSLNQVAHLKRVTIIGATSDSNGKFVHWLQKLLPDASVQGIPGQDWNQQKANETAVRVSAFNPQVIIIGLGMPTQELLAQQLLSQGYRGVIATVGGAIDQLSGAQKNAPRWVGRFGVEWLWRLATQPKRLWRRYLIEPWKLVWIRARQGIAS